MSVSTVSMPGNSLNDHIRFPAGDTLRDARLQVVFQNEGLKLLDGLAHGIGLAQNIDAIFVFVDHLANTFEVPLYIIQAFNDFLLFSAHACSPLYPRPGGMGILYLITLLVARGPN